MSHAHHDLAQEFPEYMQKIHYLKQSDMHFAKMLKEYEEVSKETLRAEERIDLTSEDALEELKRKRMKLKDSLFQQLSK